MTKFTILLGSLALTATAAVAQNAADTDGDGMLSLEEAQAAMPDMAEETFLTLDGNADGLLDAEEVAAAQEAGLIPVQ